jgi:hypothetical protein
MLVISEVVRLLVGNASGSSLSNAGLLILVGSLIRERSIQSEWRVLLYFFMILVIVIFLAELVELASISRLTFEVEIKHVDFNVGDSISNSVVLDEVMIVGLIDRLCLLRAIFS